ncbi:glycoside hydrolase domain-containing protein [Lederbergia panacisoli]|uniref:glycoside hydrolase domain-containing protein n=1 Tax=Lederbergia panacisoli TaxID=1255251 RepID=UPI00214AF3CA|nr:glycoside hydrolase domain-containing protein [Lederbergia panacisoli]MCR2823695.1 DUF1906 domain-containing protein [Lederbergia panacisoli]
MKNRSFLFFTTIFIILLIPIILFFSNDRDQHKSGNKSGQEKQHEKEDKKEDKKEDDKKEKKEKKEKDNGIGPDDIIWGIDSASLTTKELYACVKEQFGTPKVWGRYLGDIEDVSFGLTSDEVEYLHSNKIKILIIYNHITEAKGYENGKSHAEKAISMAKELKVPKGKAIFADIEPSFPVDAKFIEGWFDEMSKSSYIPAIYGVFSQEQALFSEYNKAANNQKDLKKKMILWTAHPQKGITSEKKAPKYQPEGPKDSNLLGWQYGIDAKNCNIDTDLFKGKLIEYVW